MSTGRCFVHAVISINPDNIALLAFKKALHSVTSHLHLAQSLREQCASAITRGERANIGASAWRRLRSDVSHREKECEKLRLQITVREAELKATAAWSARQQRVVKDLRQVFRLRIEEVERRQRETSRRITHARKVLINEVVGIFGVGHVAGVWDIAGLPLPTPEEMRLVSSTSINAALLHVIHLLNLFTRYLSIALPFTPTFPKIPHVGRPVMKPNLPFINTTKFRDKTVLWMSSTALKRDYRSTHKHRQFLVAYGLLSHSMAYLAWSQGVEGIGIGGRSDGVLMPAISILQLAQAIADSSALGVRSHEPGTSPLTHLGFSLDVVKVVEAATESENREDQSDGWDLIDA